MGILAILVSLVSLVTWIWLVVKMFMHAGILHGILGLICGIYAIYWGIAKGEQYGVRNVAFVCLAASVIGVILQVMTGPQLPVGTP